MNIEDTISTLVLPLVTESLTTGDATVIIHVVEWMVSFNPDISVEIAKRSMLR